MAQGSRQVQTQAQQQIQTLSPQQILVVKLLELPAVELEDRVRAELLENPALEEGKEDTPGDEYPDTPDAETGSEDGGDTSYDSLSDYLNEDDIPDYKLQENNRSKGEQAEEIPFSDATSFYETLRQQLGEQDLTPHQRELAEYLIGSLDDDGLLRKSLDSISDELAIYAGIDASPEELEEVLKIIQDFDPAGLGARTLQECLLIQIRRKEAQRPMPSPPQYYIEEDILTQCYEEFTRKHWDKIMQKLGISEDTLQQAVKEICKLNPRPGASLGEAIGKNMQQIVPDFLVDTYDDGTINVTLNNRNVPELRMSRDFTEMVEEHTKNRANQSKESREAMMFLKQKNGCRTRFHRCREATPEYADDHHAGHHRPATSFLPRRRRVIAPPHDSERCCRTYRVGHLDHLPCEQQQVCTDQLRHLPAEILLQRRLHNRRRRRDVCTRNTQDTQRVH